MAEKLLPREKGFSEWYVDLVLKAKLADYSDVKGCMVIRPNGYALWENMQRVLDKMFKDLGHKNAYFPLLIPESYLKKEAEHVEGFNPQLAVVTHAGGAKLEEPFIIRPTSETIINRSFSKWIQSYRDLPLLINQWANVMRWEMRTRLFLRTTEFLWQEGHTCHETEEDAEKETLQMLEVYRTFAEDYMAMPVLRGRKSETEKFAGALRTYSIEAMMQDRKALQSGTSHNLGQNFARQFDLKFQAVSGDWEYAWNTSWGVSTRLVGGLVMTHGDDSGIVIPPKLAPVQVVITPIWKSDDQRAVVLEKAQSVAGMLRQQGVRVHVDARENLSPGAKYYEWERKGVPLRVEIGPRDVDKQQLVVAKRVVGEDGQRKEFLGEAVAISVIPERLRELQQSLLDAARLRQQQNTYRISEYGPFKKMVAEKGGFYFGGWCGSPACEERVKEETKATIRVLPDRAFRSDPAPARCLVCGESARHEAVWARAY
jgi:prolyl-tRNA synthetase